MYCQTVGEAKKTLAGINMYQRRTEEMYRRTSKNEQIRANEGYNEEHNNTVEKSQQKKERIQIPMKITSLLSQKRNIIFFFYKYYCTTQ